MSLSFTSLVFHRTCSMTSPSRATLALFTFSLCKETHSNFSLCLFLTDPPQFEERPRDQRVMSDRVASFTCRATGSPEPKIQWRKNNRRINGNSRLIVVQVPGGSILRIEPVKYQRDEAVYECVVENAAGDTIKASAKLEVLSDDREYSTFTFGKRKLMCRFFFTTNYMLIIRAISLFYAATMRCLICICKNIFIAYSSSKYQEII